MQKDVTALAFSNVSLEKYIAGTRDVIAIIYTSEPRRKNMLLIPNLFNLSVLPRNPWMETRMKNKCRIIWLDIAHNFQSLTNHNKARKLRFSHCFD